LIASVNPFVITQNGVVMEFKCPAVEAEAVNRVLMTIFWMLRKGASIIPLKVGVPGHPASAYREVEALWTQPCQWVDMFNPPNNPPHLCYSFSFRQLYYRKSQSKFHPIDSSWASIPTPLLLKHENSPKKRLVPKKESNLSLLSAVGRDKDKDKGKDLSDVLRRVSASASARGFEIYVDPTYDPEIGEIVMVKKKG
jgi:hypothetical protein